MWTPSLKYLHDLMVVSAQAAAGAVAGPLHGAYLGLFISPTPILTPASVMADIAEATYTGYARQALVWGSPYISAAGPEALDATGLIFQPTDAVTPNTALGMFLADAATVGNLIASVRFPPPGVPLPDQFHALQIVGRALLDFNANWGDATLVY